MVALPPRIDAAGDPVAQPVRLPAGTVVLDGELRVPVPAIGVVAFAHGSGSGRYSPRNRLVARRLERAGLATLMLDLLDKHEQAIDEETAQYRFDIPRLARRVTAAIDWLQGDLRTTGLPVGLFGASTGAAAALIAAAERPERVVAVVSRGGRPDLAGDALHDVLAPTLLLVGSLDTEVISLNRTAATVLPNAQVLVVPGASHLFEEPGRLELVGDEASAFFVANVADAR